MHSLVKHRWEHSPHWHETSKLLLSKHQQVQLLEVGPLLPYCLSSTRADLPILFNLLLIVVLIRNMNNVSCLYPRDSMLKLGCVYPVTYRPAQP
jgi:hypothetical protein